LDIRQTIIYHCVTLSFHGVTRFVKAINVKIKALKDGIQRGSL
jgi:hypothetical protein